MSPCMLQVRLKLYGTDDQCRAELDRSPFAVADDSTRRHFKRSWRSHQGIPSDISWYRHTNRACNSARKCMTLYDGSEISVGAKSVALEVTAFGKHYLKRWWHWAWADQDKTGTSLIFWFPWIYSLFSQSLKKSRYPFWWLLLIFEQILDEFSRCSRFKFILHNKWMQAPLATSCKSSMTATWCPSRFPWLCFFFKLIQRGRLRNMDHLLICSSHGPAP